MLADMTVRQLHASSRADLRDVQQIHDAAPAFCLLVEGRLPPSTAAEELFAALPTGKTGADKFVLGFYSPAGAIGCADIIRGYPEPDVAFIGLLLFSESAQARGLGPIALQHIYALAAEWGCRRIRLAVIDKNERAASFWRREGFAELYRKPSPAHTGDAIVMERNHPALYNVPAGSTAAARDRSTR